ncbi:AI-2E family transporter [Marisediminicola senii]|uniref:AI-2E family transporter n=1 Tax=Marisediminicola senii TaxID=2711233 RepID=UPI001F3E1863|nr:AI-2E family transporter [Marisediminicola senii]
MKFGSRRRAHETMVDVPRASAPPVGHAPPNATAITPVQSGMDAAARRDPLASAMPPGMVLAGAWSWRILVIAGVAALLIFLVVQLRLIVIPLMLAVLLAALLIPFVQFLQRHRWPKWLAVTVAEVGILAIISGLVVLVVTQIMNGFPSLRTQSIEAYTQFTEYLQQSPLALSQAQISAFVQDGLSALQSEGQAVVSGALSIGTTAGHVLVGLLLVLFATLILLIDGRGIWQWVVRLFPRAARPAVSGSGAVGWTTLTTFVRVQIFVAAVDAIGIGIVALALQLPLAIPIAVAVFLGSFVPVVGAVLTGTIAVFVALIYQGPVSALIMLIGVLIVQQVEGHVLQPLVMGVAVKIHPLAVVLAVGAGGFLAGIPGALFAVPIVATVNAMVAYVVSGQWRSGAYPEPKDIVSNA